MKRQLSTKTKAQWRGYLACWVYLCFLFTIHLFGVPATGYTDIAPWKYRSFIAAAALFCFVLVCVLIDYRLDGNRMGAWRPVRKQELPLIGYLLFTALSALVSQYPGVFWGNTRQEGAFTISLYVLTAVLFSRYFRPAKWIPWLVGSAVSLFCLFGLIQFAGGNPLTLFPQGYQYHHADIYFLGKYWSTVGNAGLCVALLVMAVGLFFVGFIRGNKSRMWASIPLFLAIFCIVELEGEAGILALLVGIPLLLPVCIRSCGELSRAAAGVALMLAAVGCAQLLVFAAAGVTLSLRSSILSYAGVLLCIGVSCVLRRLHREIPAAVLQKNIAVAVASLFLAGVLVLALYDGVPAGFLQEAQQLLRGNWNDDFGSGRLYIWRRVLELVPQAPLFGGGPDTLGLRGIAWKPTLHPVLGVEVTTEIDAAHNELLHILVNQGALALLAYLAVLVRALLCWWKNRQELYRLMCGAAVLFYLLQSLFGISSPVSAPFFWMALGCLMSDSKQENLK